MPTDTSLELTRRPRRRTAAERVEADIRSRILNGRYQRGGLLPGRRSLAEEYEVASVTIEQAVKQLVGDGLLRSENGRGTFVAADAPASCGRPLDIAASSAGPWDVNTQKAVNQKTIWIVARIDEEECAANPGMVTPAMEIVRAADRALGESGSTATFFNMLRAFGTGIGYAGAVEHLVGQGMDAIIFVDIYDELRGLAELRSMPNIDTLPLVYVSGVDNYIPCTHVYYSNVDAGYKAAEALCKAGYREIVFFAPFTERWVDERIEGARAACERQRETVQFSVLPLDRDIRYNYDDFSRHMDAVVPELSIYDGFDGGIMAANDSLARCIMNGARQRGREAGVDYGIVGFDDEPVSLVRGLTTVRRPLEEMGKCAAKAAIEIVNGSQAKTVHNLRASIVLRTTHHKGHSKETSR